MTKRFTVEDDDADIWENNYFLAVAYNHNNALKLAERLNKLSDENKQLKSFKQRVFDLIDKTIEEETQIAENIEEVTQETNPYAMAVNRLTINTLENLKWELQE